MSHKSTLLLGAIVLASLLSIQITQDPFHLIDSAHADDLFEDGEDAAADDTVGGLFGDEKSSADATGDLFDGGDASDDDLFSDSNEPGEALSDNSSSDATHESGGENSLFRLGSKDEGISFSRGPGPEKELKVLSLQFLTAEEAASVLTQVFGDRDLLVSSVASSNQVILRGSKSALELAEALTLRLDKKPTSQATNPYAAA